MAKKRKNANGEGTIYKIQSGPKRGRWIAQITVGTNPDTGKPKRKSFYGKTRGEAKEKMEDYRDQMDQGLELEAAQGMTFGEWLLQFLELYKKPTLRTSSYESYTMNARNHIIPKLGDIYLPDLNTAAIQALYNKLNKKLQPATVHKIHNIIDQAIDKAVEVRLLAWNPAKATERLPVKNRKGEAMPEGSLNKFLDEVAKLTDRWRAGMLLLIGTGLREGEMLALEWTDMDLEEGFVDISKTLSTTKTNGLEVNPPKNDASNGRVPLPQVVVDALKKHKISQLVWALKQGSKFMNKTEDGRPIYVFASEKGTYTWPRNFHRKYSETLKKAGIPHIKLHSLRHTFATKLIEEGEDIRVVQELLRHANIKTTASIYAHVTPKAQKKAANKMDSFLRRQPTT